MRFASLCLNCQARGGMTQPSQEQHVPSDESKQLAEAWWLALQLWKAVRVCGIFSGARSLRHRVGSAKHSLCFLVFNHFWWSFGAKLAEKPFWHLSYVGCKNCRMKTLKPHWADTFKGGSQPAVTAFGPWEPRAWGSSSVGAVSQLTSLFWLGWGNSDSSESWSWC